MSEQRVECHAPDDQCYGCPHYWGKADVCQYADDAHKTQVDRLNAEIEQKQLAIDAMAESLDEAKYAEPELRAKLDRYRAALRKIADRGAYESGDAVFMQAVANQALTTKDKPGDVLVTYEDGECVNIRTETVIGS